MLMTVAIMSVYENLLESAAELEVLIEALPPEVLGTFGLDDASQTTEIPGYVNSQFTSLYLISVSILTGYLGVSAVGSEITSKTISFLITKPVSRTIAFLAKFGTSLVLTTLSTGVILIIIPLSLQAFIQDIDIPWEFFGALFISLICFQVFFLALGYFLGVTIESGRALVVVVMLGIVSFFMSIFSNLSGVPDWVSFLDPYYYFDINGLSSVQTFQSKTLTLLAGGIVFLILGVIRFKTRNIDI